MKKYIIFIFAILSTYAYSQEQLILKNGIVVNGHIMQQTLGKDVTFSIEQTEASVCSNWASVSNLNKYESKDLSSEWKRWLKNNYQNYYCGDSLAKLTLGNLEFPSVETVYKNNSTCRVDSSKIELLRSFFNNQMHRVLFLEEGDVYRFIDKTQVTHTFNFSEIQSIRYQERNPMEINGILDVIEVKNGPIYKGQVIEKVIGKLVKLKTEEGTIKNIISKEIVCQKKEGLNPDCSILEQAPFFDEIENERGVIIEQYNSYITFLSENNDEKRIELKSVNQIRSKENPSYKSLLDILVADESVYFNRKLVSSIICKKDKNGLYVIPDSIIDNKEEIVIETYPQELVIEMADNDNNIDIFLFPIQKTEKKYSYTYEDMVNKRIHESDKKVTVNKTLRRMYKIRHGVYVLYIPKTEKTYICKIK